MIFFSLKKNCLGVVKKGILLSGLVSEERNFFWQMFYNKET